MKHLLYDPKELYFNNNLRLLYLYLYAASCDIVNCTTE